MHIDVEADGAIHDLEVVRVRGAVDLHTAGCLKRRLADRLRAGAACLVVNLAEVERIDSFGLGAVASACKRAAAKRVPVFVLVRDDRVARLLRLCGVRRVIPLAQGVPEVELLPLEAA